MSYQLTKFQNINAFMQEYDTFQILQETYKKKKGQLKAYAEHME